METPTANDPARTLHPQKPGDTRLSLLSPNSQTNEQTTQADAVLTARVPQRENPHAPEAWALCKHPHSKTPMCNYSQARRRRRRRKKNSLLVSNSLCTKALAREAPGRLMLRRGRAAHGCSSSGEGGTPREGNSLFGSSPVLGGIKGNPFSQA